MKRRTYSIFSILDLPERNRVVKKSIEDVLTCAPQKFLDFEGVPSTTMSFTDMYMFGVLLGAKAVRVVVKLYMSNEATVRYEAEAYEDLFSLYENGYTRNVAILLGHTLGFTGDDIVNMLAENTPHARKKFNINLMYMFCRVKKERPALTALPEDESELDELSIEIRDRLRSQGCTRLATFAAKRAGSGSGSGDAYAEDAYADEEGSEDIPNLAGAFEYGYIATVQMQGQKFADVFRQLREGTYDATEFRRLVFQIVYTLYIMKDTGITHGDLHFNNIFVDHLHEGETRTAHYRFFGTCYAITSDRVPRIFDLDRSSIKDLGINPFYRKHKAKLVRVPKKSYKLDDMYFYIDNIVKAHEADYLVRARDMIRYTERPDLSAGEKKARQAAIALIGKPFLLAEGASESPADVDVFAYPR